MRCDILLCMKVSTVGLLLVFQTFHFISMTGLCFIVLFRLCLWLLQKLFGAQSYGPGTGSAFKTTAVGKDWGFSRTLAQGCPLASPRAKTPQRDAGPRWHGAAL